MKDHRPPQFLLGMGKGAAPSSRPRRTVLRIPRAPPALPLRMRRVAPPEPVSVVALGVRRVGMQEDHAAPLRTTRLAPEEVSMLGLGAPREGEEDMAAPLRTTRAGHYPSPVEGEDDPATWHGEWWAVVEASNLAASAAGSGDALARRQTASYPPAGAPQSASAAMTRGSALLLLILLHAAPSLSTSVTTLGRGNHAFDISALPPAPLAAAASASAEVRLADGASLNYNGQFAPSSDSLLFVSDRNGALNLYMSPVPDTMSASRREAIEMEEAAPLKEMQMLSWDPIALKDRPSLIPDGTHLVYISTDVSAPRCWATVNATHLPSGSTRPLPPHGVAGFIPFLSPFGEWTTGEELNTYIYAFLTFDGSQRTLAVRDGGWACWADEITIFFHNRDSDDWYGVYRAQVSVTDAGVSAASVELITPPGFLAFTPQALLSFI